MMRDIRQTIYFKRNYKKLLGNQRGFVNEAIRKVQNKPEIGEEKKGDLAGIFVYKFLVLKEEMLLAYAVTDENVTLHGIGVHENYYRDLKKSMK